MGEPKKTTAKTQEKAEEDERPVSEIQNEAIEKVRKLAEKAGATANVVTSYDDKLTSYVATVTLEGDVEGTCQATGASATEALVNAVEATRTYIASK